jgi:hypothetical protein
VGLLEAVEGCCWVLLSAAVYESSWWWWWWWWWWWLHLQHRLVLTDWLQDLLRRVVVQIQNAHSCTGAPQLFAAMSS